MSNVDMEFNELSIDIINNNSFFFFRKYIPMGKLIELHIDELQFID